MNKVKLIIKDRDLRKTQDFEQELRQSQVLRDTMGESSKKLKIA